MPRTVYEYRFGVPHQMSVFGPRPRALGRDIVAYLKLVERTGLFEADRHAFSFLAR